jgi:hypothetical protein
LKGKKGELFMVFLLIIQGAYRVVVPLINVSEMYSKLEQNNDSVTVRDCKGISNAYSLDKIFLTESLIAVQMWMSGHEIDDDFLKFAIPLKKDYSQGGNSNSQESQPRILNNPPG